MIRLVAEVGSNHDGSLPRAIDLIKLAKQSGATDVKFQYFRADPLCERRHITSTKARRQLHALELPDEWLPVLQDCAYDQQLGFACTAYDVRGLHKIAPYVDWLKVASYELTDHEFLREHRACQQTVVLSTGMASAAEVVDAVDILGESNLEALLHCVTAYPCPVQDMDLRVIPALIRDYPDLRIGLSDHTEGIACAIGAVALGATFIEKHFTDDRARQGPDHGFALEPAEFALMARCINEVKQALGDGAKQPHPIEAPEMAHRVRR